MRHVTRWMFAVLALIGFHGAVAQVQSHSGLINSHRTDGLDLAVVDTCSCCPETDGNWYP